ncbi:Alpha/Beta hydrolase protein [Syncephalis plumigaleata]|nr:Alpha/Beta hydrolase protein [Syncephalis plumigaleata]
MVQSTVEQPNILSRIIRTLVRLTIGIPLFTYDYIFRICLSSALQFKLPWTRSSPSLNALEVLLNGNHSYGKHRVFEVDGNAYHCVESGNPNGKLILLLHGFPQCWYTWRHQLEEFGNTDDYHVVAIDMKGFGGTYKPTDAAEFTPQKLAKDIEKVVHALNHDTCILAGHDWGGIVAWYCAALRPDFIEKLAIINAPHIAVYGRNISLQNPDVSLREIMGQLYRSRYIGIIQLPWPFSTIYLTWRDYEFVRFATSDMGNASAEDMEIYKAAFALPGVAASSSAYYRSLLAPGASINAPIRVPTIVIWGDKDVALQEHTCLTGLDAIVEDLQICTVTDATHFCLESSYKRVNSILREFIDKGNDVEEVNEEQ